MNAMRWMSTEGAISIASRDWVELMVPDPDGVEVRRRQVLDSSFAHLSTSTAPSPIKEALRRGRADWRRSCPQRSAPFRRFFLGNRRCSEHVRSRYLVRAPRGRFSLAGRDM